MVEDDNVIWEQWSPFLEFLSKSRVTTLEHHFIESSASAETTAINNMHEVHKDALKVTKVMLKYPKGRILNTERMESVEISSYLMKNAILHVAHDSDIQSGLGVKSKSKLYTTQVVEATRKVLTTMTSETMEPWFSKQECFISPAIRKKCLQIIADAKYITPVEIRKIIKRI